MSGVPPQCSRWQIAHEGHHTCGTGNTTVHDPECPGQSEVEALRRVVRFYRGLLEEVLAQRNRIAEALLRNVP